MLVLVRTASLSAGPLSNTAVMGFALTGVLSIIGVQIFAGRMGSCSDGAVWVRTACKGLDGDGKMREWAPYEYNFDNIIAGFQTQLMLASQDDWPVHMFAATDVAGPVTGRFQV